MSNMAPSPPMTHSGLSASPSGPSACGRRWRRPARSRTASSSTAPGTGCTGRSRCRPCCSRSRRRCPRVRAVTWPVAATIMRRAVPSPQPAHEPGAADVAMCVLAEHHVGQRLLVAVLGRRRRQRPEEAHVAPVALERRLARRASARTLSIMTSASCPSAAQTSTHSAQPLQWTRVDEDAEAPPARARAWPARRRTSACGRSGRVPWPRRRSGSRSPAANVSTRCTELGFRQGDAQDGRVRAGADAGHAADALLGDELRAMRGASG